VPSPKKERNFPYTSVEIAQALASVGLRDVHLPDGKHLNARRVLVPDEDWHARTTHDM
jgi:hypothetical protein